MQVKTNYINSYKNLSLMHASYATLQEFLQTVHTITPAIIQNTLVQYMEISSKQNNSRTEWMHQLRHSIASNLVQHQRFILFN